MKNLTDSGRVATRHEDFPESATRLIQRHLCVGWFSLALFAGLGLVLEALHGLKIQAYLNATNETRRLMWTLAHAHGAMLGLVHLGFAFTLSFMSGWHGKGRAVASRCLIAATLLMPTGFFLGGVWTYSGDPGLGIALVPAGGLLLLVAVLWIGLAAARRRSDSDSAAKPKR